ncbi:acyltransferase [Pelagicoccus sp. SDUM812002]|uniref:acyltransferase family protein n=1 Tax=Pelagicoccus sp. SDUM812002 TaxID=3041266 RepID=UPI00280CD1E1|nr:acyltransferase [Pelagicoccus sp. SDUM812002]MDQ8186424.1 acyltransferase [Pelagicoccus sp. SDUM812002]
MPEKSDKHRFQSLDALRAVACFLVIWQHVSESLLPLSSGGKWASDTANYFDFGRIGVVAFFCISGFVIPRTLEGGRLPTLRSFAVNRFFRLYPIYWVAVAIGVYSLWLVTGRQLPATTILANTGMVATFVGEPHVMGLFWTLEVELVFYFATALLYLSFGKYKLIAALVGFSVCYKLWQLDLLKDFPGNLPILGYLLAIMFTGSAMRCIYDLEKEPLFSRSENGKKAARILFALMVYLVAKPVIEAIEKSFTEAGPVWNRYGWGHTLGLVLFAIFFFLPKTPQWLSSIGRSTYSAYLLHAVVFTLMARLWKTHELPKTRLEFFIVAATAITFGIAALSYKYIEKPSIRLGKRLAGKKYQATLASSSSAGTVPPAL